MAKKKVNEEDLKSLQELANEVPKQGISLDQNMKTEEAILQEEQEKEAEEQQALTVKTSKNRTNSIDSYRVIDNHDLPQEGALYPESWRFAYRCPTADEVAAFSALNDEDVPSIVVAVEDLIRKCVRIYDEDTDSDVPTGEINDAHRIYFMLLIREYYLHNSPLSNEGICTMCKTVQEVPINARTLKYEELREALLDAFDGRIFTLNINVDGSEETEEVKFRIPTVNTTSRFFKHIIKIYRNKSQGNEKESDRKDTKIFADPKFLLMAPYLYLKGTETIRDIVFKYKAIIKNENLHKAYLIVISSLKLEHKENIDYICCSENCGAEEELQLRFPKYSKFFIGTGNNKNYF